MIKQMTIDGDLVPIADHPDDTMECSDNTYIRRGDAFIDCIGQAHRTDEERREANREYVESELDARANWSEDYVASEDYGDGYAYLVKECHHDWNDHIKAWVIDGWANCFDWEDHPEILDALVESISEKVYDWDNWEGEFACSEYSSYYGDGCCLASFGVGEYEDQISLSDVNGFTMLHSCGELEALLEDYNGDLYISRNSHYDKELDRRVPDGYVSKGDHPDILGYTNVGGQWHYVVSSENMCDAFDEAIDDYGDCDGEGVE
jgi:hypothetical protein